MTTSGHPLLPLSADQVLTTTRAVRKRLDLSRPVDRSVIEECLQIAQQAPSASNRQHWHFIVVTEPAKKEALAAVYGEGRATMMANRLAAATTDAERADAQARAAAPDEFTPKLAQAPPGVIPCVEGAGDAHAYGSQAAVWGTIAPAAWSFMLAARARGLGTVWTTIHLYHEREAADILGIPYDSVMQAALTPVAYTIGTEFKLAKREPLETMTHWDTW